MKSIVVVALLVVSNIVSSQDLEYSGTYQYGTSPENGRTGIINVFQNSDTTLLFYLEVNRGTPSYNSGAIVGQMNIYGIGEADFTMGKKNEVIDCSMNFWFNNDSLFIRTNNLSDDCGYGYGVYSDGDYVKNNKPNPDFFIDRRGIKTFFKDLDWEEWWEE